MKKYRVKLSTIDLKYFSVTKGLNILDYGCGSGRKALDFASKNVNIYAVDTDKKSLSILEKNILNKNIKNISITKIEKNRSLLFKNSFFDRVILSEVLEHVDSPSSVIEEIYRVMKKGGILCVSIPTSTTERVYNFLNPNYYSKAGHRRVFTKNEIILLLESEGFGVNKIYKENFKFAIYWILASLLKINPSDSGETENRTSLDKYYYKIWGILYLLRVANLVERMGNSLFPKSIYLYAEKK
jgi:ubiquinone/menaquinone biosynthesis C-methylase UbiE